MLIKLRKSTDLVRGKTHDCGVCVCKYSFEGEKTCLMYKQNSQTKVKLRSRLFFDSLNTESFFSPS